MIFYNGIQDSKYSDRCNYNNKIIFKNWIEVDCLFYSCCLCSVQDLECILVCIKLSLRQLDCLTLKVYNWLGKNKPFVKTIWLWRCGRKQLLCISSVLFHNLNSIFYKVSKAMWWEMLYTLYRNFDFLMWKFVKILANEKKWEYYINHVKIN